MNTPKHRARLQGGASDGQNNKKGEGLERNAGSTGLPGGDRTPDPQLRRLMLYPTELRADMKKAHRVSFFIRIHGRSTRIRTLDPLVPNQVRYQTAPHSDKSKIIARTVLHLAALSIYLPLDVGH